MDDLRLSLLLIGIALVAGIYLWGRYRRRASRQAEQELDALDQALLQSLDVARDEADETSLREALGELQGLKGDRGDEATLDVDDLRSVIPGEDSVAAPDEPAVEPQAQETEPAQAHDPGDDLIITMNVLALPEHAFLGSDLRQAFDDVELQYGEMKIFHHYGVGEMSREEPVFSVANVLEPGFLPMDTLDELSTPGICLFMRLPGPLDGRVAFELLLNTGQRLADKLGGELRDDARSLLTQQRISQIRERIAAFERNHLEPAV